MSFTKAKDSASKDPTAHNLNTGLYQLTKAIDARFDELERKIVHLSQQISQIPLR